VKRAKIPVHPPCYDLVLKRKPQRFENFLTCDGLAKMQGSPIFDIYTKGHTYTPPFTILTELAGPRASILSTALIVPSPRFLPRVKISAIFLLVRPPVYRKVLLSVQPIITRGFKDSLSQFSETSKTLHCNTLQKEVFQERKKKRNCVQLQDFLISLAQIGRK
jgi:hypothetical protein